MGGSGFIAAFCAGLLTGYLFNRETQLLLKTGESCGEALSLLTWVVFGAYVAPKASQILSPSVWFYALLSLSLVRMVPVWVSLAGSELTADSRLFIGWFGPRGLASIVFAVLVLDARFARGQHDHRHDYRLRRAQRGIARHKRCTWGPSVGTQRWKVTIGSSTGFRGGCRHA
ncbi:sodium/hydrogen exchanger [Pseudomonas putida S11]|nr:sodium/hydrogen exchanger [Pseudomonas putida S11]